MNDELEGFEDELMDNIFNEDVTNLVKAAAKSADKLTAIIVENNRHNSKKMSDEDIYQIYQNSFAVAISTIMPIPTEPTE